MAVAAAADDAGLQQQQQCWLWANPSNFSGMVFFICYVYKSLCCVFLAGLFNIVAYVKNGTTSNKRVFIHLYERFLVCIESNWVNRCPVLSSVEQRSSSAQPTKSITVFTSNAATTAGENGTSAATGGATTKASDSDSKSKTTSSSEKKSRLDRGNDKKRFVFH